MTRLTLTEELVERGARTSGLALHERAEEILAGRGKGTGYTAADYVAALEEAEHEGLYLDAGYMGVEDADEEKTLSPTEIQVVKGKLLDAYAQRLLAGKRHTADDYIAALEQAQRETGLTY